MCLHFFGFFVIISSDDYKTETACFSVERRAVKEVTICLQRKRERAIHPRRKT